MALTLFAMPHNFIKYKVLQRRFYCFSQIYIISILNINFDIIISILYFY